jgi:hypothetical protein
MNSITGESPSAEPRVAHPPIAEGVVAEGVVAEGVVADLPQQADTSAAEAEGGESPVNYDESALLELEIEGTDYRLDVGRAGTALCISTRSSGTWSWDFRGEAKWQNNLLRCKAFDRTVLSQLGTALIQAADDSQS